MGPEHQHSAFMDLAAADWIPWSTCVGHAYRRPRICTRPKTDDPAPHRRLKVYFVEGIVCLDRCSMTSPRDIRGHRTCMSIHVEPIQQPTSD